MTKHKTSTTAGAFRRALEERLKKTSQTDQTDINRLRRQVSFDRLLARLFRDDSVPWVLKGGYALELRFKTARSMVDITAAPYGGAALSGRSSYGWKNLRKVPPRRRHRRYCHTSGGDHRNARLDRIRRNRTVASAIDCPRTTVRRKDSRIHAATQYSQQSCEGSSGYGASDRRQHNGLA